MSSKNRSERGSQSFEFALILLPMFAMVFVMIDVCWMVFAQSTIQRAVRVGAHVGVTYTAANTGASCLTDVVKNTVQANSFGLLSSSANRALIKVNYFLPPNPTNTSGTATDVSSTTSADAPGNIITVSVQNYSLIPIFARMFSWTKTADGSPFAISVSASDMIEDSINPACVGTAP